MSWFWFFIEIAVNLFEGLILFSFFDSFLTRSFKTRTLYGFLAVLQASLVYLLNQTALDQISTALISIAIAMTLVMAFYTGPVITRILLTLAFFAIWMVSEFGLLSLLNFFIADFFINLLHPSIERITAIIVCKLGIFLLLKVIQRFSSNNKHPLPLCKMLPLFSLPLITILLIISMQLFWINQPTNARFVLAGFSMVALLFANLLIFDQYHRLFAEAETVSQMNLLRQNLQFEADQIRLLENQNLEVRKIAHDIKNSLLPVAYQLEQGDLVMSRTRLGEIVDHLGDLQQPLIFTGQPLIDTILRYKIAIARDNNVKIDVKGQLKQDLNLPDLDISIMLGNALDNAIEATEQVADVVRRRILVDLLADKGVFTISITNPITKSVVMRNGQIVSTKQELGKHGFGLDSIRQLAEKNGGHIQIESDQNTFYLTIFLVNLPLDA